jgi:hypothetical protein
MEHPMLVLENFSTAAVMGLPDQGQNFEIILGDDSRESSSHA